MTYASVLESTSFYSTHSNTARRPAASAAATASMQRSAAGGSETQQIIHDVAYDYFGRRVAVCSSDQWIRIYDDSVKTAEWKAHGGSIWRLTWAHPEFGQVLASCSFDRKICIWEERGDTEESTLASNGAWRLARELQDSRDSVNHVTFAPKRWGLLLASCSADRKVRVHEAPDVMDLANWGLTAEFEADAGKGRAAVAPQCVAWNPSPTDPLMLVIGMSDGSAILWMQQENSDGTVHWVRVLTFDSAPAVSKPPRGVTYEPLGRHVASGVPPWWCRCWLPRPPGARGCRRGRHELRGERFCCLGRLAPGRPLLLGAAKASACARAAHLAPMSMQARARRAHPRPELGARHGPELPPGGDGLARSDRQGMQVRAVRKK